MNDWDADAQRPAADRLPAAHNTFRQFVESSPFGLFVVDADFRLALVSAGAHKVFAPVRPLLGRDFAEIMHALREPGHAAQTIDCFRHTLATGDPHHSLATIHQRDGAENLEFFEWTLARITLPDGRPGVVCHFYDMSKRERYEAALRRSEQQFRATFDTAAVGIAHLNPQGRWLRVNQRLCEIVGYTAEELRQLTFGDITHPEDLSLDLQHATDLIAGLIRSYSMEKRYLRKAGDAIWVNLTAALVRDPDGTPDYFVSVVEDITKRKVAEAALVETDRRKNVFIATLAHELRNPLAPIRTAARALGEPGLTETDLRRAQGIISRQTKHMALLLDDLLDMSRISRGALTLRREVIDLRMPLEAAIETARPLLDAKHQKLSVSLAEADLTVAGDGLRLTQIVANILMNAAKFTPADGHIELTVSAHEGEIAIFVRDSGIGIALEMRSKVFDMFAQVDPDHIQDGLGIGLALVKGLVELHAGRIEAHSEGLNRGSEFRVFLPRMTAAQQRAQAPKTAIATRPTPQPLQVLIADDNQDSVDSLAMLLQMSGYQVYVAYSGAEAVEVAERHRPEAIVLDIGMPGLSGFEVARQLRASDWGFRPTLIAVTGWGQASDKRDADAAGFDHHLTKPMDPDELEALIAAARRRPVAPDSA